MQLLSRHCQAISIRFQKHSKSAVWLSPSFQNEIIHFLSVEIRGMIEQELHEAQYYTLLADESKDMSKREQLSIAFRYIYKFRTVERFVGFTLASELNARALADYIFQKVSDLKLDLGNLVSQCYDGASVMSGCNTGVQTIIKEKCPQAVYIHCSAHRLNLVLVDVSKQVKAASDFFAHLQSIYVFFSSSKCHELFLSIQKAKGGKEIRLKKLSDTRWSCRYDSIVSVMATYPALLETLEDTADGTDRMKAIEATGILAGLKSYDFVVSLTVYKKVLGITSKLSDVLQKESLDYGSAASLIQATIETFESMKSDGQWDLLWQESVAFANHHGIEMSHPRSRRQRHTPAAMESYVLTTETVGNNTLPELSSENCKVHVYFATIDVIVSEMKERFSNINISLLKSVGSLNPKSKHFLSPSCLSPILSHYSNILPQGNSENEVSTLIIEIISLWA